MIHIERSDITDRRLIEPGKQVVGGGRMTAQRLLKCGDHVAIA